MIRRVLRGRGTITRAWSGILATGAIAVTGCSSLGYRHTEAALPWYTKLTVSSTADVTAGLADVVEIRNTYGMAPAQYLVLPVPGIASPDPLRSFISLGGWRTLPLSSEARQAVDAVLAQHQDELRDSSRPVFFRFGYTPCRGDRWACANALAHLTAPDSTVAGLVYYPFFTGGSAVVPVELRQVITERFTQLKRALPDSFATSLGNAALTLGDLERRPNDPPLWFRSEAGAIGGPARGVYVSPQLVRAVAVQSVGHLGDGAIPAQWTSEQLRSAGFDRVVRGYYTLADVALWPNNLLRGVRERMDFGLAHELAHLYLGTDGLEAREAVCDCYAVLHLRRAASPAQLGVLSTMVTRSVREGTAGMLWGGGVGAGGELVRRADQITGWLRQESEVSLAHECAALRMRTGP